MGGSQSHEFMVVSDAGEDLVAICRACGYSANLEKAVATPAPLAVPDPAGDLTPEEFHTPCRKTIAEVAAFTGLPETSQMKSLVLVADGKPVLALLRGDHQLSETKFGAVANDPEFRPPGPTRSPSVRRRSRSLRPGRREEHRHPRRPGAGGPAQHDRRGQQERLPPAQRHPGRRFPGRSPRPAPGGRGRPVPALRRALDVVKTVEVGHIFKLGYKYSDSMGLRVLAADGKEVTPIMGSLRHRHRAHSDLRHRAVSR